MKKVLDFRNSNSKREPYISGSLAFIFTFILTGSLSIAISVSILTFVATRQYLLNRSAKRQQELSEIWPEVIDHLISGLHSGRSISECLSDLSIRGPEMVRADFARFAGNLRAGVDFDDAISGLRENFSNHGSDQIFEALLLSKTLGGGDLIHTLRTLSSFMREDLDLKREISIKHGWIKGSAHISAAAPWLLLIILATQPATASSFSTPTGIAILIAGLLMTFIAYLWMARISRLPITPRVFVKNGGNN